MQLGILGVFQAALLDAGVHQRNALGIAQPMSQMDQRIAIRGWTGLRCILRRFVRDALIDQVLQAP